jgi:hypothetical protein
MWLQFAGHTFTMPKIQVWPKLIESPEPILPNSEHQPLNWRMILSYSRYPRPEVNVNTLEAWIGKTPIGQSSYSQIRNGDQFYDELRHLKKEVARLTEERDLLMCPLGKMAVVYFAKEQW